MGRLSFLIIVLTVALSISETSSAALDCVTEIRLNDSGSKVFVDNILQKITVPMFIGCKATEQKVRILSSDKQEFVRVLPNVKSFTESDRIWNVFFLPQNSKTAHASVNASHAQLQDSYQVQILNELTQIRKLFESIVATNPKLKPISEIKLKNNAALNLQSKTQPKIESKTVERAISSLSSGQASVVNYAGFYVQLHSLMKKNFDAGHVKNEIAKHKTEVEGAALKFCKWRSRAETPVWTRVVVGPFSSADEAKQVVRLVGRDTFTVNNLNCYENELSEVEI